MNRVSRMLMAGIGTLSLSLVASRPASATPPTAGLDPAGSATGSGNDGSYAQEPPATLFGNSNRHEIGGFGALEGGYTRMVGRDLSLWCVEGAFIVDHTVSVGGAACGVAPRISGSAYGDVVHAPDDRLEIGYGGLAVRYHLLSRELMNVSLGATIGGGAVAITNRSDVAYPGGRNYAKSTDGFFSLEPRMAGYLNLTRWARVGAFIGYRFAGGIDTANLSSKDISGPTLGGTVQFGWF